MQDKLKKVYGQIKMSDECVRRIEQAMQNKAEDTSLSLKSGYKWKLKPAVLLAVVALLLLADGTVYACTGEGIISRFISYSGNAVFTRELDEDGNQFSSAVFDTANAKAPAEFKDGRLWFKANGENMDITDQVSEDSAFTYDYRDEQGIIHYLIVGGEPETFGYAEFMYSEETEWIGGYFQSGKVGESINPDWLQKAKKELGIPWS